jgi:hypothetical protein
MQGRHQVRASSDRTRAPIRRQSSYRRERSRRLAGARQRVRAGRSRQQSNRTSAITLVRSPVARGGVGATPSLSSLRFQLPLDVLQASRWCCAGVRSGGKECTGRGGCRSASSETHRTAATASCGGRNAGESGRLRLLGVRVLSASSARLKRNRTCWSVLQRTCRSTRCRDWRRDSTRIDPAAASPSSP